MHVEAISLRSHRDIKPRRILGMIRGVRPSSYRYAESAGDQRGALPAPGGLTRPHPDFRLVVRA
jgi:hypothetical protein